MPTKTFSAVITHTLNQASDPPIAIAESGTVQVSYTEQLSGVKNPKWKSQVKAHENATTPYTASRLRVAFSSGHAKAVTSNMDPALVQTEEYSGQLVPILAFPQVGVPGNCENDAYLAFVRKANKELQSLQGLVSLGELAEVIHSIRHPLDALKRGLHDYLSVAPSVAKRAIRGIPRDIDRSLPDRGVLHIRQGQRRRAKIPVSRGTAIANALSGTLLEYQNGWSPLINDVKAASKVLAEHFNPSGVRYRKISGSANAESQFLPGDMVVTNPMFGGHIAFWSMTNETRKASCKVIGEVVIRCDGSASSLARNAGFSLAGFVPTIWELLPLSYVADWFTNIGSTLEAYAFNTGAVSWFSKTIRLRGITHTVGIYRPPGGDGSTAGAYLQYDCSPGAVVLELTNVQRFDTLDWTPSIAFSLPGSGLLRKLSNVTALYAQARSSSRQISRLLNG